MVEIHYDGNLGNNLFQYCFGRILAEKLGYELVVRPLPGFPGTYEKVEGQRYESGSPIILRGQNPDLSFTADAGLRRKIVLTGYFQQARFYEPHAQRIREWLRTDHAVQADIGASDVVVGVRRGRDYIPRHGLPLSYYDRALASLGFKKVFLCTNEPGDPFVRHLARKYDAPIRPPGALDNLSFISKFQQIVISNSTFLWWAAFLSSARAIIFPRPSNGFWSKGDPLSRNIELELKDPRYQYLASEEYSSEFLSEKLQNWQDAGRSLARRWVKKIVPGLGNHAPRSPYRFSDDDSDCAPKS